MIHAYGHTGSAAPAGPRPRRVLVFPSALLGEVVSTRRYLTLQPKGLRP